MRLLPRGARRPGRPPPRGATTAAAGSTQGLRRRRWARAARGASNASQRSSHERPRAPRQSPRWQPLPPPSLLPPAGCSPSSSMADLKLGGGSARRWFCPAAAFSSLGTATLGGEASRGRRRVGSRRPRRPSPAPSLAGLLRLRSGICTGNLRASNSRPARVSAAASGSTQPLVIFFLIFMK